MQKKTNSSDKKKDWFWRRIKTIFKITMMCCIWWNYSLPALRNIWPPTKSGFLRTFQFQPYGGTVLAVIISSLFFMVPFVIFLLSNFFSYYTWFWICNESYVESILRIMLILSELAFKSRIIFSNGIIWCAVWLVLPHSEKWYCLKS